MKLVTFLNAQKEERVGVQVNGQIIELRSAFTWMKDKKDCPELPNSAATVDMLCFIREQDLSLSATEAVIEKFNQGELPQETFQPESQTRLLSPVPRPPSMRDAYAFRQHVEAARRNRGVPMIPEFDQFPVFYFTNHQAVTGPGELPVMERALDRLDFELEVAIVMGKPGRNLKASEVDDHIFGYTIMNDWSARAEQMMEMKMSLGPAKGKDFATSLGPYLVPRKYLKDYAIESDQGERHDLGMRAFVNDKQVSNGNLKDISYTFGQIMERVSYGVSVHPGEVIGSGTVGTGCFLELNGSKITDNQWLKPGDKMVLEVDQLGRLENTIARAES